MEKKLRKGKKKQEKKRRLIERGDGREGKKRKREGGRSAEGGR